jgi:hypothetical protein
MFFTYYSFLASRIKNRNEDSRMFDSTNHSIVCIPPNTSTTKNGKSDTEYSPFPVTVEVRTCAVIKKVHVVVEVTLMFVVSVNCV